MSAGKAQQMQRKASEKVKKPQGRSGLVVCSLFLGLKQASE